MTSRWVQVPPFNTIFLLGVAPLISLVYLVAAQDPILGTERDFGVFWTASVLLMRGDAAQLFDPVAFQAALSEVMGPGFPALPFLYPPHGLLFLAPLCLFPKLIALVLWLLVTFAFLIAMLRQHFDRRWLWIVGLLLSPASVINIACGQNGFLSAGLLAGGLLFMERRPPAAGILIGLLSFKPQLGILIPVLLLVGRHWRVFAVATVTVIAMVAASLLLGPDVWVLFLTKAAPQQIAVMQRFDFVSLTYFIASRQLGLSPWQAWAAQGVSAALAACGTIWVFRRSISIGLKASVAMIAAFLISPYMLPYDMIIVSVAILLAAQNFSARWWECLIFAAAWLLPAFSFPPHMPVGPAILTLLFITLLRRADMMTNQVDDI